uniref:Uncharacterized protein n=1 Tax=Romanomermis culicivorax TaxID=13658 RepID=A0A915JCB8_ROMCU
MKNNRHDFNYTAFFREAPKKFLDDDTLDTTRNELEKCKASEVSGQGDALFVAFTKSYLEIFASRIYFLKKIFNAFGEDAVDGSHGANDAANHHRGVQNIFRDMNVTAGSGI